MSRILTFKDLKELKGIPYCPQHIRRKEARGEFPKRVYFSEKLAGWLEDEIDAWVAALPRKGDGYGDVPAGIASNPWRGGRAGKGPLRTLDGIVDAPPPPLAASR